MDNPNANTEWDGGDDGTATATLPPAPTAQQAAAVEEQPIPETYTELLAEHQRLHHAIPLIKSRAERAKLSERHKIIKDKLAALQNMAPAPHITANENAQVNAGRRNRHVHRASRLEKLRAAQAAFEADPDYFLKIPAKPLRPVSPAIAWLLTRNPVLHSIAWLRQILTAYECERLGSFNLTHPDERIAEIKEQLANCTERSVIETLQSESATLGLQTALVTARNARIALQTAWQPVEQANYRLLQCCLMELGEARTQAVMAEVIFFQEHPLKLPHEETSASKAFDSTIQQITQLLEAPAAVPVRQLAGASPATAEHTSLSSLLHLDVLDG